jgi:PleD family two-component response regulator
MQEVKPDQLIASADKALYVAKQQGRDRYCTANDFIA